MQKSEHKKTLITEENHRFGSACNATARLQLRNVSGGPPPLSLKYIYIYIYTRLGGLLRGALSLGPAVANRSARETSLGGGPCARGARGGLVSSSKVRGCVASRRSEEHPCKSTRRLAHSRESESAAHSTERNEKRNR